MAEALAAQHALQQVTGVGRPGAWGSEQSEAILRAGQKLRKARCGWELEQARNPASGFQELIGRTEGSPLSGFVKTEVRTPSIEAIDQEHIVRAMTDRAELLVLAPAARSFKLPQTGPREVPVVMPTFESADMVLSNADVSMMRMIGLPGLVLIFFAIPLLAVSAAIGITGMFLGSALFWLGNYTAYRLGQAGWVVGPAGAAKLFSGSVLLAVTATIAGLTA